MRAIACAVMFGLLGTCAAQTVDQPYVLMMDRSITELRELAQDESAPVAERVSVQMEIAQRLVSSSQYAEALTYYLRAWQAMPAAYPKDTGVRGIFLTSAMGRLAAKSPEAKQAFAKLRDEIEQRLRETPSWSDLSDWVALNVDTLGDHDRVLTWVDRNMPTTQGRKSIERQLRKIDDLLIVHGRWRDLGRVQADVVRAVSRAHEVVPPWMNSHSYTELIGPNLAMYEHEVAKLYAALMAADRFVEASEMFDLAASMEPRADLVDAVDRLLETYPELRTTIERVPLKRR